MYLLTQLSIFDAVQNPKQIRQTEKNFEWRKIFGNNNKSATSANKKYDRKVLYNFSISAEKNNVHDCSFETTFLRKVPNGA